MAWYDEAIFYHIYPLGITGAPKQNAYTEPEHRLDKLLPFIYKIKETGFNAIYIGPLFESVGHGYETTDYKKLDSRLGTNEDLKNFVTQCHNNGIRVVLDGVFNHTGRDFFAFKDIQQNREASRYKDWYCNVNFYGNNEYNDGISYDNWGGYNLLVKLNQHNFEVREYIADVIRFWVKEFDIDGIRLDAADVLDFEYMKMMRCVANEIKPDFWLMGEVIHGDYSRWVNGDTLHSVTNYHLHKALYSGHNDHNYFEIAHTVKRLYELGGNNPDGFKLYNFVDNHDVERIYTKLNNKNHFVPVHILLYTLPGIPSVYYGSEFGIEGQKQYGSDNSLRPEISYEQYVNFTENNSFANLISRLGEIRKEAKALSFGDYQELLLTNCQYVFSRTFNGQSVIVAVNNRDSDFVANISVKQGVEYKGAIFGEKVNVVNGILSVSIKANSGEIWLPLNDENEDAKPIEIEMKNTIKNETIINNTEENTNEKGENMERKSGVLMHISSLYGDYSTGGFGDEAKYFIDFIADCGFSYWQVLPFCMTDECNSPYKSFSTFAGNPYFVDLNKLYKKGLLNKAELDESRQQTPYVCEFDNLRENRINLLVKASSRVKNKEEIENYIAQNHYLAKFCEFMALKSANGDLPWLEWKTDKFDENLLFAWKFIQFEFFNQWKEIKDYANSKNIKIIGDIPIYVSHDSSDVWSNKEQYHLDKDGRPTLVAGVPPDYFSEDGQLWGNPIYNWDEMKKDGFKWWCDRISHMAEMFDALRIDHFRGIESYWAVPASAETAKSGKWQKGPGMDLINAIKKAAGETLIIAEDLGDITPEVYELVRESGFPGMRVFQFGFLSDGDSIHKPHNYPQNSVAYTGTHDNNTLLGYLWELDDNARKNMLKYCGYTGDWGNGCESIIRTMFASHARLVIMPVQDLLGYGSDTRMNTPGSVGTNWQYRITREQLESIDKNKYKELNNLYSR